MHKRFDASRLEGAGLSMTDVADLGLVRSPLRVAVRPWLPVGLLGALVALLYLPVLGWLWNAWMSDPFYTHGILVPPLVAGLTWWAWPRVRALPREQDQRGALLLALALALLAAGRARDNLFVQSLSMLSAIAGLVLVTQGAQRTRALAGPLAVLLFAVPYPFLAELSPYLQALSADGAARLVGAFGIPVHQDAFTITAGTATFEVAPLCSGLSSVLSMTFVAFVCAHVGGVAPRWQGLLAAAAVPLAVASNLVRIASTIAVGVRYGPAQAGHYFEGVSNVVLYLLALAPLLAAIVVLRRRAAHA
jgi:exosortase